MTLAEKVLLELNDWRPAGRDALAVRSDVGWSATLVADLNNELGAKVWELAIERDGPASAEATMRGWAESIAARSSGLMERLRLLEVDDGRSETLLRSDRPTEKGDEKAYYEIVLAGTARATVRRYIAVNGRREQVAFAVTREALAKLVDDIAG
jgi:hypothetical protein